MPQQLALRLALPALVLLTGTVLGSPSNAIVRGRDSIEHIQLVDSEIRPSRAELEAECGDLGVMEVPEGEDPRLYRHCQNHPSTIDPTLQTFATSVDNNGTSSVSEMDILACLKNPGSRGCSTSATSQHYCWRACGLPEDKARGFWCWLAWNRGIDDWVKCGFEGDQQNCQIAMDNGAGCGVGNCVGCGCGC